MSEILKYELKRLLFHKVYLILCAVTICYSWGLLTRDVILGISNTAPFSEWSFGYYLAKISPILSIMLLFFVTFFYSKQEKEIKGILLAAPTPYEKIVTIRYVVIAIGFLIQSGIVVLLSFIFLNRFFGYTQIANYIGIIIAVLLPTFFLFMGIGRMMGGKKNIVIYGIIMVILILAFLSLPYQVELFGESFFKGYPLEIGGVEPEFHVPMGYWLNRICYSVIGIGLFFLARRKEISSQF